MSKSITPSWKRELTCHPNAEITGSACFASLLRSLSKPSLQWKDQRCPEVTGSAWRVSIRGVKMYQPIILPLGKSPSVMGIIPINSLGLCKPTYSSWTSGHHKRFGSSISWAFNWWFRTAAIGNVVPMVLEISPSFFSFTESTYGITTRKISRVVQRSQNLHLPRSFRRISFLDDIARLEYRQVLLDEDGARTRITQG